MTGLADYPCIPFIASLIHTTPDPESGHKRDIGVVGQTHQVGALFEALNERVLMAASDLPCIFLPSKPSFTNIMMHADRPFLERELLLGCIPFEWIRCR